MAQELDFPIPVAVKSNSIAFLKLGVCYDAIHFASYGVPATEILPVIRWKGKGENETFLHELP